MGPIGWALPVALLAGLSIFHPLLFGRVMGGHVCGSPPFQDLARASDTKLLGDIEVVMLPFLAHTQREFAAGRVPLWNPWAGCGAPFLANQQSAVLHPVTWLAALFPWRWALTILALFRWGVAFTGAWMLAGRLGLTFEGRGAAAAAFSLSGSIIGWIGYPVGAVLAHIPLLLALGWDCGRRSGHRQLLALTGGLASSILVGHLEFLPIVWGLTVLIVLAARRRSEPRPLGAIGPFVAAPLLCGALLLPAVEYMAQSQAVVHRNASRGPSLVAHPTVLGGLVQPQPVAGPEAGPMPPTHQTLALYLGSAGLVLVAIGVLSPMGRRLVGVSLVGIALLWSHPLSQWLWQLPVLGLMAPPRLLAVPALGLALAVGNGLETLRCGARGVGWAAAGGLATGSGLLALSPSGRVEGGLPQSSLLAGGIVMTLAVLVGRRRKGRAWPLLFVVVLIAERALVLGGFNRWDRPERIFPEREFLKQIEVAAGSDRIEAAGEILLPNIATAYAIRDTRLYDAIGVGSYKHRLAQAGEDHFFGLRSEVPTALSRRAGARIVIRPEQLPDQRVRQLEASVATPPLTPGVEASQTFPSPGGRLTRFAFHVWPESGAVALSLDVTLEVRGRESRSVKTSLKPRWIPASGWKHVEIKPPLPTDGGDEVTVRLRTRGEGPGLVLSAAPRRRGPRLLVAGRPEPLGLALQAVFAPVVVDPGPLVSSVPGARAWLDPGAEPRARVTPHGRARFVSDGSTEVTLEVWSSEPAELRLADVLYPGWRAWVDDQETPIRPAGSFRAVAFTPGTHRISFRYRPESYRLGLFLTVMGVLGLGAAAGAGLALPSLPTSLSGKGREVASD